MRLTVKKLYNGNVELRDYNVLDCINRNDSCIVVHDGKSMTLNPTQLKMRNLKISDITFKSKIPGGKDYKLYAYKWIPNESN
jgi:hypothetical protein